ncbi:hypothetical protein CYY_007035 [Polysphondylium violaceum]|uniref:Palmitoyltransferase n=1 Tax=Polysphondylium violaceum TaxID=133409 RepID=A0A8J4V2K6_9MYCE|nr:hypothetical protein CYY_007035 [Polysphondylium violaceum]
MARTYTSTTKTYCNNRFITGPDKGYFISAMVLVFIPEIPFLIFICPLFEEWVTPAIYVVSIYIWLAVYAFLIQTAYTDPGIVPRGVYNDSDIFSSDQRQPLFKKITIKGMTQEVKWCETCSLYRPPRANHCGMCNNCVEKFDHHCPWVGNCIGRRNYKTFLYFLYCTGFKCLFAMGFCVAHIIVEASRIRDQHPDYSSANVFNKALNKSHYLSIIIIVYALAGLMFVGSLGGFHLYLLATNQTTNESIKKTFKKGNPFRKSIFRNIVETFCAPNYPSYYLYNKKKDRELKVLENKPTRTSNDSNNNNSNSNILSNTPNLPSGLFSPSSNNSDGSSSQYSDNQNINNSNNNNNNNNNINDTEIDMKIINDDNSRLSMKRELEVHS